MFVVMNYAGDERVFVEVAQERIFVALAAGRLVFEKLMNTFSQHFAAPSCQRRDPLVCCRTENRQQQVYKYQPDDYVQYRGIEKSHGASLEDGPRRQRVVSNERY